MLAIKLTVEQRIEKGHIAIMANDLYVGLAPVMMVGEWSVLDNPSMSACTNGRDVMYGRAYMEVLNDAEFRFVILHSVITRCSDTCLHGDTCLI